MLKENITFSLGLFSIHDQDAAELQYHYASPEVVKAPSGTHKVDGDSIYRIASVSKLFTVYAGMIELSSEDWNRPITEFIPELAITTDKSDDDDGESSLCGSICSPPSFLQALAYWDVDLP